MAHRLNTPVGRHIGLPLNILRTKSRVHYIMNGVNGMLRVPLPCASVALVHDLKNTLYPEIFGYEEQKRYNHQAKRWMHQRDFILTGTETVVEGNWFEDDENTAADNPIPPT
ncbi:MAG: hypothetical protein H7Z41_17830 [Cytophagales bacterium]|nr:hypothetical protein [Armatimonadota bacterium]